jgi:hypothetical protein
MDDDLNELVTWLRALACGADDAADALEAGIFERWGDTIHAHANGHTSVAIDDLANRAYEALRHATYALDSIADLLTGGQIARPKAEPPPPTPVKPPTAQLTFLPKPTN